MEIVRSIARMREDAAALRASGRPVGFVPTMGALHDGHLSLVEIARRRGAAVVASVFVNPKQFGPAEDFATYPRDLERDAAMLRAAGVEALFAPEASDMYPEGFRTHVEVEGLSDVLIGALRPGHFRGVATVVLKLLAVVQPDLAVFGWKDAQQLVILKRMARDLALPVEIVGAPIVREPDGLAMSSRNAMLSPSEREAAPAIRHALLEAQALFASGERDATRLRDAVARRIEASPPLSVDAVDAVSPEDLSPVARINAATLLLVSARVKRSASPDVLLIDNLLLAPEA